MITIWREFFYWDDVASRRLRPDMMTSERALEQARAFARAERDKRPDEMFQNFRHWLTQLGVLTARPAAFVIFALYAVAWITIGNGFEWHSLGTLATWP
jgi:hypothetical protein